MMRKGKMWIARRHPRDGKAEFSFGVAAHLADFASIV